MAPALPATDHLAQRLHHPHYYLNAALTLPLPLALLLRRGPSHLSPTLTTALLAAPILVLALSTALRTRSDNLETLHARITSQLRILNLAGLFFCRHPLALGPAWTLLYLVAWLLVAFFFPQPDYLGPHKLRYLSAEEFETQVLRLPPASTFASDPSGLAPRIVELDPSSPVPPTSTARRGSAPPSPSSSSSAAPTPDAAAAHLVHFHAPHSALSRDLHTTLARLSERYASPALTFSVLDASADDTQACFYDLGLATGPTSRDVPLLRLYDGKGRVRIEAPKGEKEAQRSVRRRRRRAVGKTQPQSRSRTPVREADEHESDSDGDDDDDDDDESEDERQVEQERAQSRYRWDTSADAIERTFQLRARSSTEPAAGAWSSPS